MSRACFFVLFLFSIAVKFGDCEELNPNCEGEIKYGVDGCTMSMVERMVDSFDRWFGGKKAVMQSYSFGEMLESHKVPVETTLTLAPGTNWCGAGNKSKDGNDLGRYSETDACCKAHDMCPSNLEVGQTKMNLINNGSFTRSNCKCDNEFYDCLKNVKGRIGSLKPVSYAIGKMYFNTLGTQCFECECPTDSCNPKTDKDACEGRCKKYKWVPAQKY